MRLLLDSSALLKHYVQEPGTAFVRARLREADELLLSVLVWPEIHSSLNRLRREGALDDEDYAAIKERFAEDFGNATVVALAGGVLATSVRCLERARLRASDAVHVASALEAGADRFVSADRGQCWAARAFGLHVEEVATD